MENETKYIVTVSRPGYGAYTGGTYDRSATFRDKSKARYFYTDMLVKYPNCEVKIEKVIQ